MQTYETKMGNMANVISAKHRTVSIVTVNTLACGFYHLAQIAAVPTQPFTELQRF